MSLLPVVIVSCIRTDAEALIAGPVVGVDIRLVPVLARKPLFLLLLLQTKMHRSYFRYCRSLCRHRYHYIGLPSFRKILEVVR